MKIGDWTVLPTLNQLQRGDVCVKLEPRAMDLLVYLANAGERVVPTDELLRGVWQGRVFDDGIVYKRINQLRKALGDDPQQPTFIETIPKRGYRLIAAVARDDTAQAGTAPLDSPSPRSAAASPSEPLGSSEPRSVARSRPPWLAVVASVVVGSVVLSAFLVRGIGSEDSPRLTVSERPFASLTTELGDETEPTLSPDGSRVAFVRDAGDGRAAIYVTEIGSTQQMPLTPNGEGVERSPRWSPAKPQIAFLRQRDQTAFDLVLVSPFGDGVEQPLTTLYAPVLALEATPLFAWTPDGRLLFSTAVNRGPAGPDYALFAMTPETGAIEQLRIAKDGVGYDTSPALSPDQTRLAFVRRRAPPEPPQLMVQEVGPNLEPRGMPVAVPGVPPSNLQSPVWSADSTTLAFVSNRQIYEWSVGGTARPVYSMPLLPWGFDLAWRDGRARAVIALSTANLDVWALPLSPTSHRAPLGLAGAAPRIESTDAERHHALSRDGTRLAFVSGTVPQLWLANADGSERSRYTDLPGPVMGIAGWSSDGKRIAFSGAEPGRLVTYVLDVDTRQLKPLFDGYVTSWSADDRYLYAFRPAAPEYTFRVHVADGHIEELFQGGGAVETLDGTQVLYAKADQWGVFSRSLVGDVVANPERRLVDDYYPARGKLVPVAAGFYYVGHSKVGAPRAFRYYDFATGVSADVAAAPKSVDIGMTVSPDETELLYAAWGRGSNFDLRVFEFDAR